MQREETRESVSEILKQQWVWDETFTRMGRKKNLSVTEQRDLLLLEAQGFKDEFLREVGEGRYHWNVPRKAMLNKLGTKKKRVVYVYDIKDRVAQGVLYRAFSKAFGWAVSDRCFSYKRGVQTLSAIDYLTTDEDLHDKVGVKLDITAYFNSVDKKYRDRVLLEITDGEPKLRKLLGDLYEDERCWDNGKLIHEYKGLIPGSPFSSFMANYCLKDVDRHIAEDLRLTYARYSDDMILFGENRESVEEGLESVLDKLAELGLKVNSSKYQWFTPGEDIDFLGLKIKPNGDIDLSDNSVRKMKKKIKHACVVGRTRIAKGGEDPERVAVDVIGRFNYRTYKCYVLDPSKFGWAYYAFRYITTDESIVQLDQYFKDRIRQMVTGKNNSGNIRKVPESLLESWGYIPMGEMYTRFKEDFEWYCNTCDTLGG